MSDYTKPYFDAVAQLTAPTAPFEVETVEVAGIPLKAFKNAERSLGAFLAAGRNHDANLFLQYQGDNLSYGEFFKAVDQVCDWLLNEAQIQKGDPIAIAMRNRPEWLVSFVATVTIGAVAVPLNSWGKAQELTQGLVDSKAKLVFCDRDRLTFIRELNTDMPAVVERFVDVSHHIDVVDALKLVNKRGFMQVEARPLLSAPVTDWMRPLTGPPPCVRAWNPSPRSAGLPIPLSR